MIRQFGKSASVRRIEAKRPLPHVAFLDVDASAVDWRRFLAAALTVHRARHRKDAEGWGKKGAASVRQRKTFHFAYGSCPVLDGVGLVFEIVSKDVDEGDIRGCQFLDLPGVLIFPNIPDGVLRSHQGPRTWPGSHVLLGTGFLRLFLF